jgi:hypothetical protein
VQRLTPILACLAQIGIFGAATAGADTDINIDKACPGAAIEHAQLLAKRHVPKDVATVARPALRNGLLQMERQDQDARNRLMAAMAKGDPPDDDPARIYTIQVDAVNLRRLKHIINQDGFPTIGMVGLDGVHAAFLLTQHADDDSAFQERMLRVVTRRLRTGEINGNQYALLTDRVLRAQGKPQRYGTQFEMRDDEWKPEPIADEAHVDERRHALGLISLANYSCKIHAVYGPANPH